MGYTTSFEGKFTISPQLTLDDYNQLKEWVDDAAPTDGPGSYLQWEPTKDGRGLMWDGNEKFYHYTEWLQYLLDKLFTPKGYLLAGSVSWQGEEIGDTGTLVAENGSITAIPAGLQIFTLEEKVRALTEALQGIHNKALGGLATSSSTYRSNTLIAIERDAGTALRLMGVQLLGSWGVK